MFHVLVGPSSSCGREPLVLRRAGGPKANAKQPASHCTAVDIVTRMQAKVHRSEVDQLQQSHAAELKRLEAASKTREDQWRAREAKWETERKSLQDRLLKAPKPQAGSAPVAGVSDEGDIAGSTRYLR